MPSPSSDDFQVDLNRGSVWHRWDPHVHAPGTLLNNQFTGEDPWGGYLTALETSDPPIRAIGVTDYYLTDTYKTVLDAKRTGRLPKVDLIFPNVELRLDIGTIKGRHVNVHLLVNPEDPAHLTELNRFLGRLSFRAHGDTFVCSRPDLIRLGRVADPSLTDDISALRYGAMQFKVNFKQLREEFGSSAWAKENILVAVAAGEDDGTSGVRGGADATLRQEIECFADIVFGSSPVLREFWLGGRNVPEEQLRSRYRGLKPCLHGSDAHEIKRVGVPDGDRFSWVKGGLEFDALRQACIDPAGRAFVGMKPPEFGTPSQRISHIHITGAAWSSTPNIAFNPGLVAIIGARGSGKTALADMIAMACDAIPPPPSGDDEHRPSSSFLARARHLLGGARVEIAWRAGEPLVRALDGSTTPEVTYPRARYLSQQFVEELCSSSGMTDALLREIERVIFESHPITERDGTANFAELLELRASRFRHARAREEETLAQLSARIGTELEKDRQVGELTSQVSQTQQQIERYTADRAKLVASGSEERISRLTELTAAADKVRGYIRFYKNQEQALLTLRDEVTSFRENEAPEHLRRSKERHLASRITAEDWELFMLDYKGDVDQKLATLLKKSRDALANWQGTRPTPPATPETPLIAADANPEKTPLATLEAEIERLQKLVNADVATQKQFAALSEKLAAETSALDALKGKLEDAKGAKDRVKELRQHREAAYRRVFEAIVSEQNVLTELYRPLMTKLAAASGTLNKLTFTVSRTANVGAWARIAEEDLLDLRRQGPFKGKGRLQELAEDILKSAWEKGDPEPVNDAMVEFLKTYLDDLLQHSMVPKGNPADYRIWLKRFAQWLYSTDHIELRYGIDYDGVDIRKLSPGTRGIVLLLLYLALDDADDRPLIIDQPEENLDPKSVFDELVDLFIATKSKRQVIMVTHNANLVVNTDADQIIIAEASSHQRGELPDITYVSGGLENAPVRKAVCDILEGGEQAFRERSRRLRVRLET